jgi:hypothetical protein
VVEQTKNRDAEQHRRVELDIARRISSVGGRGGMSTPPVATGSSASTPRVREYSVATPESTAGANNASTSIAMRIAVQNRNRNQDLVISTSIGVSPRLDDARDARALQPPKRRRDASCASLGLPPG